MDNPNDKHTKWLSRGLLEACLDYIDLTKRSEALRACLYEFTYAPIIEAFKKKVDDGFDVEADRPADKNKEGRRIIKTSKPSKRGLGSNLERNGKLVCHLGGRGPQFRTTSSSSSSMAKKPQQVWTGSTNVTPSGFLGQSNVGHLIKDSDLAGEYLKYWNPLSDNRQQGVPQKAIAKFSPYPPALVGRIRRSAYSRHARRLRC